MNQTKRDTLVESIGDVSDIENVRSIVSLEVFFDGNDDPYSIWCNFDEALDTAVDGYELLKSIRDRDDVHDVLVAICSVEEGEWPFADAVYVITETDPSAIGSWFERFTPDAVVREDSAGVLQRLNATEIPAYRCWFD